MTTAASHQPTPIWVRPAPTRREGRIDLAIAIGLYVAAVLSQQLYRVAGIFSEPADAVPTFALLALAILPLGVRRTHPVIAAIAVSVGFIACGSLQVPELLILNISLFTALYSVGAWVSRRGLAIGVRAAIVLIMAVWLLVSIFQAATDPDSFDDFSRAGAFSPLLAYMLIQVLINLLYFAAAWWFGDRAFVSARQRWELEQRTAELEQERERTAAQAVALDRVRIARELHDAVAHHVSVIGIQAGAARTVLTSDTAAASEALQTIERASRDAIHELHDLLTTLRDSDEPEDSVRGLDRVP
ncbi:MAG TPA: histidine kinase dimerization/phosphoacceptor domain-containing protein, partial [Protaetiibacter sp.]|nr:histidine kinase dimerization/phosphoacceptor domain-containing protein [Protaetiibacter sp.]